MVAAVIYQGRNEMNHSSLYFDLFVCISFAVLFWFIVDNAVDIGRVARSCAKMVALTRKAYEREALERGKLRKRLDRVETRLHLIESANARKEMGKP
jgi:hypothetical protein